MKKKAVHQAKKKPLQSKSATKKKVFPKMKKKTTSSQNIKKQRTKMVDSGRHKKTFQIPIIEMLELPTILVCDACGKEIVLDENILQEKVLVCCGQVMTRRD